MVRAYHGYSKFDSKYAKTFVLVALGLAGRSNAQAMAALGDGTFRAAEAVSAYWAAVHLHLITFALILMQKMRLSSSRPPRDWIFTRACFVGFWFFMFLETSVGFLRAFHFFFFVFPVATWISSAVLMLLLYRATQRDAFRYLMHPYVLLGFGFGYCALIVRQWIRVGPAEMSHFSLGRRASELNS